jgi:serine/threonine-protein kinase
LLDECATALRFVGHARFGLRHVADQRAKSRWHGACEYPVKLAMPLDFVPGTLLTGKYRVEHLLTRGAVSLVIRARHVGLDHPVAIKVLGDEAAENPDAVRRFLREARATARVASEHVARVTDVGTLEDGRPYMAMECLDGVDLGTFVAIRGRLELDEAAELMLQIAEGLAEAHAMGIVHRDIKPSNLFVTWRRDGTLLVKVLDFGIATVSRSSRDADVRSDIWALGLIFFELLTGETPKHGPMLPIRSRLPELPIEIASTIGRCMMSDPAARFPSLAELAAEIAPFAPPSARGAVERIVACLGSAAPLLSLTPVPASSPVAVMPAGWGETAPSIATRLLPITALGVVLAALLGILGSVVAGAGQLP